MNEFKNWTEVTTGFYRYAIAARACYEILIMYWADGTPLGTAQANLYSTGAWKDKEDPSKKWFEREDLLTSNTVQVCLEEACKDLKANDPLLYNMLVHGPVDLTRDEEA